MSNKSVTLGWSFTAARSLVRKLGEIVVHFETAALRTSPGLAVFTCPYDTRKKQIAQSLSKSCQLNRVGKQTGASLFTLCPKHLLSVPLSWNSYDPVFQTWCHSSEGCGAGEKKLPTVRQKEKKTTTQSWTSCQLVQKVDEMCKVRAFSVSSSAKNEEVKNVRSFKMKKIKNWKKK